MYITGSGENKHHIATYGTIEEWPYNIFITEQYVFCRYSSSSYASNRASYSRFTQLFTVALSGGFPTQLPLPIAGEGSYSPDGARIAYVPLNRAFSMWKGYRGGETTPIWIAKLSDSTIEELPRENSNDFNPMWVDDRIFFLSDREGAVTLFSYDTRKRAVIASRCTVRRVVEVDDLAVEHSHQSQAVACGSGSSLGGGYVSLVAYDGSG